MNLFYKYIIFVYNNLRLYFDYINGMDYKKCLNILILLIAYYKF